MPGSSRNAVRIPPEDAFSFTGIPNEGETTQDFVLGTGPAFNAPGLKVFLAAISGVASAAPKLPDRVKGFISDLSRLTNEALHAIGANSAKLDFFEHPVLHPLVEPYYSQTPIRYGNYVAKLRVRRDTQGLRDLASAESEPKDQNGLRTAVVDFFRSRPAEYEVEVQLRTDAEHMPIEDASVVWPEEKVRSFPLAAW